MARNTAERTFVSYNVLIVDDEAPARKRIRHLVEKHPSLSLLGEATNGPEAVEKIEALRPDLVFMDVQMPAMDGFDVLRMLSSELSSDALPDIVFVTAFNHYAVEAFEVAAIDYLLKPVSDERFAQAIERVAHSRESKMSRLDSLLDAQPEQFVQQLPVRYLKRVKLLNVSDISHIVSEHRVVNVYSRSSERYWTSETLDCLQRRLDPSQFFRTHRSSILNLQGEFELELWEDGRLKVHLPNGEFLTVARDPAREIRSRLNF